MYDGLMKTALKHSQMDCLSVCHGQEAFINLGKLFVIHGNDKEYPLDSREIAMWPNGSLKWIAHSVSPYVGYSEKYTVMGINRTEVESGVVIDRNSLNISVSTRQGLHIRFSSPGGSSLFENLSLNGHVLCSRANIIACISKKEFSTIVKSIAVENATVSRAVIKVSGVLLSSEGEEHLPFDIRVYLYSNSSSVKIIHSFIHDLDSDQPLMSLGLKFLVPLKETELYNRHVRLGGSDGGILKEEVQGLSGLRFGPTLQNKVDQAAGKIIVLSNDQWERNDLKDGLSYIPSWDSSTLPQLSSDGFVIKKRTKKGCSWVKVTGGGRADGTAFFWVSYTWRLGSWYVRLLGTLSHAT
jgi:hypothetical protein